MDVLIAFGIGLFIGASLGVFLSALMIVSGRDRRDGE